jgi:hypothetical protein
VASARPVLRRGARGGVLAVATAVVLGLAPGASAAFKPLLAASSDARGVTVKYSQAAANDGAAALVLYVPQTYVVKLPTKAGTAIATATANARAADMGGSTVTLDGAVRVASATTPLAAGSAAATVDDAARSCAGTTTPVALWSLTLRGFGQLIQLGVAVGRVDTGPLAGGLALFICPPPADIPPGSSGRAPLGLKIVYLALRFTNAFTVPDGTHVWHLKATPYAPGSAVASLANAAEAEAQHGLPAQLTLAARPASRASRSAVSGRLTLAGKGVKGQTVRILAAGKRVGTARTNASGAFATTVALPRTPVTLTAKAVVPARYLPSCAHPVFAPLPCRSSIVSGFSAASARVRLGA